MFLVYFANLFIAIIIHKKLTQYSYFIAILFK